MNEFKTITEKLQRFIKKYYQSELIKGGILFFSFGFLYFLLTLFLEYFLWLKPRTRAVIAGLFVVVELVLLMRFVAVPILKLTGLRKGISLESAAKIIGTHFPEVKDKLLNVLQLEKSGYSSDLLWASIDQKSMELQPISFGRAINFRSNLRYLKFAVIPMFIWFLVFLSGNNQILSDSLNRVVHYESSFIPPAPFFFSLETKKLLVVQGGSLNVFFKVVGKELPTEVKVTFDGESYYLQKHGNGMFSYRFQEIQKRTRFFVGANGIQSSTYQIDIVRAPAISNVSLIINYPDYLNRKSVILKGTGNIAVPEGTNITWKVAARQTEQVVFIEEAKRNFFKKNQAGYFEFTKKMKSPLKYEISASNADFKDYESLEFSIAIVKDEYPKITVQADENVLNDGFGNFGLQVSDDYGLKKLQVTYYKEDAPLVKDIFGISTSKSNIQTIFYQFPKKVALDKGVNYALYFEVYDNDAVHGSKKAKSNVFRYRQKTEEEIDTERLKEQRRTINALQNTIENQQRRQEDLTIIQEELLRKNKVDWIDKNKVEAYIKRQEQTKRNLDQQRDRLQESLGNAEEKSTLLQNKKQVLQERIEEIRKTDKQKKLLAEIAALASKLNKEGLVQKVKELAQQNKQQERSLERVLELVKRFYVEQKTMQIANKIKMLAKKQRLLEKESAVILKEQKEIQDDFELIKNELEELVKDNKLLKDPLELPNVEEEELLISEELEKLEHNLNKEDKELIQKQQKKIAQKMEEMSTKMQRAMMAMEAESAEENIEDIRMILENLITFSFKQEALLSRFSFISTAHPNFGKDLNDQNSIKTYFEHIDDSLYVLALRLPKISSKIQEDIATVHYNLKQALENFSENRFDYGMSNQRYVLTGANSMVDYLSNLLNNLKNAAMKMGKGSPKPGGFSLPDIIRKQADLSDKMKEGIKKGEKKGADAQEKGGGSSGISGKVDADAKSKSQKKVGTTGTEGMGDKEDLDGALFQIYKEQSRLREQLQEAIMGADSEKDSGIKEAKRVLKTMEQLEKDILLFGFNEATIQKMQQLNYELLKLDSAILVQGKEKKRQSNSNMRAAQRNELKALDFKKRFFNQIEILNRQSLPLQQNYKLKVREYFSDSKKQIE
jgi:hypothetical protein